MSKLKNIVVAVPIVNAAARQKLRGIYRFLSEGHDWDIRQIRTESEFTADSIRVMMRNGIDGCIVSMPNCHEALQALSATSIPTVAIEVDYHLFGKRLSNLSFLRTDNAGIGRAGANHLHNLGMFRSFAFVPDKQNHYWSQARAATFSETLLNFGHRVETFSPGDGNYDNVSELGDFLLRLPKPLGVMAAWDLTAAQVISVCRARKLHVPSQVSVIGVDNDEFICESVTPALSTILVDREKQGYDAAVILDKMMSGQHKRIAAPICRVLKIVPRESTASLSPAAPLIQRALQIIEDNALRGIRPDDVAKMLGVSRRLLDLRFHQQQVGTIAERIRQIRMAEVERLVCTTRISDVRIAERCGFANVNAMRNLYRVQHGQSIRHFRQSHQGSELTDRALLMK